MKAKVTNKMLREERAVVIGYCAMNWLLTYEEPIYYTCGVYGWNSNVYNINGILISTGYRPAGTRRIDWQTLDAYEKKAQDIVTNKGLSYHHKQCQVRELLNEVLSKAVDK